jgi:hypothetical protein
MRTVLLALLVMLGLTACGDDDPSTSAACKDARKRYALAKSMRDYAADLGVPVYDLDAELAKFQSDHWECFK